MLVTAGAVGGYVARGEEEPDREATVPPVRMETSLPVGWNLCVNRAFGYAIGYPSGWHTDHLQPEGACGFFDPDPFEIPENSDFYGTAIQVQVPQESFDVVVRSFLDRAFTRKRSRTPATVAGRRAVRIEYEANGRGLLDDGSRVYAYVVDRAETPPLVVETTVPPGSALYASRKQLLDRAVRTLRLSKPGPLAVPSEFPPAVAEKRGRILEAARTRDPERLAALADPDEFTFSYGATRDAAAYWRRVEPYDELIAALQLPHTLVRDRGIYVWPFAYDRDLSTLTARERRLLAPLASEQELDQMARGGSGWLGWRVGITEEGRWIFFVAGD